MTNEEILQPFIEKRKSNKGDYYLPIPLKTKEVLQAMDAARKYEAIEFYGWHKENELQKNVLGVWCYPEDLGYPDIEELYARFKSDHIPDTGKTIT